MSRRWGLAARMVSIMQADCDRQEGGSGSPVAFGSLLGSHPASERVPPVALADDFKKAGKASLLSLLFNLGATCRRCQCRARNDLDRYQLCDLRCD